MELLVSVSAIIVGLIAVAWLLDENDRENDLK
jgi:hypothetical protein